MSVNDNHYNNFTFICISCMQEIVINSINKFDAFACQNCRSIYVFDKNEKNEYIVKIIKKEVFLPQQIKDACAFFSIDLSDLSISNLKTKYKELISQYHPDKVSHLGKELQVLAEEKTREIIFFFEILNRWFELNTTQSTH